MKKEKASKGNSKNSNPGAMKKYWKRKSEVAFRWLEKAVTSVGYEGAQDWNRYIDFINLYISTLKR